MIRSVSLLTALAVTFGSPLSALAATASADTVTDPVSTEDILDNISPAATPALPVDGKGGGGYMMDSSIYYPGPQTGGVQVQASVTSSVTPDFVAINAYCESGKLPTRIAVRDSLQQLYTDIKNFVGKDGRVRKSGAVSAYPYYEPTGSVSDSFNGTLSVFIRITNRSKVQAISDYIEEKACSVNWDVRLVSTQTYELSILDELAEQLNARKAVFEKLLGKRLTTISSASLSTWVDGYGTYDPEENTVDATSTLSVTFDLGTRATITPSTSSRAAERAAARSAR